MSPQIKLFVYHITSDPIFNISIIYTVSQSVHTFSLYNLFFLWTFHRINLCLTVVVLSLADKNMFDLSQQISIENDYLGPRRIEALKKEDSDWQKKAQEAVLNIQEFTVKYFEITARAQKGSVCHHGHCQCQVNKAAEE